MSARVSVRMARLPGGRGETALAVKSASTPEEICRLTAEVERLKSIAHPGVVSFVDHRHAGNRAELHTIYAGEPLERWQGTLEQIAGLVAALASSLADLHEAGVVHGRIDRSHVLRGPQGRPVLCGLSPAPAGAEPATDVAAVGRLLGELLDGAGAAIKQSSGLRWRSWPGEKKVRRALERVAAHAADPLAARRPSARALAGAILEAVPGAQLPGRDDDVHTAILEPAPEVQLPDQDGARLAGRRVDADADLFQQAFVDQRDTGEEEIFVDRPWQDTDPTEVVMRVARGRVLIGVLVLAGIAVLAAGRLLSNGTPTGRPPPEDPADTRSPPGGAPPDCPSASRADAKPPTDTAEATTWADIDGDGCVEPVTVTADGVVQVADERWALGRPGDQITLGDWDCDGSATPAVYRQSTGDVFVFDAWADHSRPLEVDPVGHVPGGVRFGTSRPSCDVPVVELASGATRPVEVNP